MKFGTIIAARTGSSRLPGKVLLPLRNMEVLRLVIKRLLKSEYCEHFVLATTTKIEDDKLAEIAIQEGIMVYRGDEENVLKRFVHAAEAIFPIDINYIVRVTSDCPMIGGDTLDIVLKKCLSISNFDLITTKPNFHHGLDYEVYRRNLLKSIESYNNNTNEEKEHILNYIYNRENLYKVKRILPPKYLLQKGRSLLLDNQNDYVFFQDLLKDVHEYDVLAKDLLKLLPKSQ